METKFEKLTFFARLKSMLKVDFKRMFTTPLVYIMAGICLVISVIIPIMTSFMDNGDGAAFDCAWQMVGSVSGSAMSMDLAGMCNINITYFLIAIFVCIFIAQDFKSGYVKNLFAVRSKKTDYCISKALAGFAGGAIMIIAYFIGAMIGGAIGGLSFETAGYGAGNIAACLICKIFIVLIFVAIALILGVAAKQRLWISVLASLAAGMLLFTMIATAAPIDAGVLNVITCLIGGAVAAAGLGALSALILNKTSLV